MSLKVPQQLPLAGNGSKNGSPARRDSTRKICLGSAAATFSAGEVVTGFSSNRGIETGSFSSVTCCGTCRVNSLVVSSIVNTELNLSCPSNKVVNRFLSSGRSSCVGFSVLFTSTFTTSTPIRLILIVRKKNHVKLKFF